MIAWLAGIKLIVKLDYQTDLWFLTRIPLFLAAGFLLKFAFLLDGSISLSPLYSDLKIDLHVRTPTSLHQSFPWLHPTQAKFAIFKRKKKKKRKYVSIIGILCISFKHAHSLAIVVLTFRVPTCMLTLRPFSRRIEAGGLCKNSNHCHFHCAPGFDTPVLAHMLDSLVRVSRRGKENHFVCISQTQC